MNKIVFDDSTKNFLLEALGKSTDEEGFIVEKSDKTQRVIASDGQEIKLKDFAGVTKGSQVFIKNDIVSLIDLHKKLER